jgi:hypothetical protein
MGSSEVLVVGETPSLGRAIADLLESGGITARLVVDIGAELPLSSLSRRFPVVIVACNGYFCATARRYARGELPNIELVVVGARDPALQGLTGIRVVPLPLVPGPLLALIRELSSRADTHAASRPLTSTPDLA